jgi:YHS domain-containing protein
MIRTVITLLLGIIAITVIRAIIGILSKGVGELFRSSEETAANQTAGTKASGQLHKDPVCGIFVAEGAAVVKSAGGKTVFFCSTACRDKFQS